MGRYVASDLCRVRWARNELKSTHPCSRGRQNGAAGGCGWSVGTWSSVTVAGKGAFALISTRQTARHTQPNALKCRLASRARRVPPNHDHGSQEQSLYGLAQAEESRLLLLKTYAVSTQNTECAAESTQNPCRQSQNSTSSQLEFCRVKLVSSAQPKDSRLSLA